MNVINALHSRQKFSPHLWRLRTLIWQIHTIREKNRLPQSVQAHTHLYIYWAIDMAAF